MYIEDAQRYPADFREGQVSKIISSLTATNPLTLFAPSGFGKSKLLNFLAYNQAYRKRYRSFRGTLFAYIDTTELVTELRNQGIIQTSPTLGQALPQTRVVEDKLLSAVRIATQLDNKQIDASTLTSFLDKLFSGNKKLRMFVILDGAEQLFGKEFDLARDMLKFLRDKYRGHLEYIFAISNAKYIEQINYQDLGNIASLLGQKILNLPLIPSAESVHSDFHHGNKLLYKFVYSKQPELRKRLADVDRLTGGYVPYIKHFLQYENTDLQRFPLSRELQLASERLLLSLTPEQVAILTAIAQGQKPPIDHPAMSMLREIALVNIVNGVPELFSPIMAAYLKAK